MGKCPLRQYIDTEGVYSYITVALEMVRVLL